MMNCARCNYMICRCDILFEGVAERLKKSKAIVVARTETELYIGLCESFDNLHKLPENLKKSYTVGLFAQDNREKVQGWPKK